MKDKPIKNYLKEEVSGHHDRKGETPLENSIVDQQTMLELVEEKYYSVTIMNFFLKIDDNGC